MIHKHNLFFVHPAHIIPELHKEVFFVPALRQHSQGLCRIKGQRLDQVIMGVARAFIPALTFRQIAQVRSAGSQGKLHGLSGRQGLRHTVFLHLPVALPGQGAAILIYVLRLKPQVIIP